MHLKHLFGAPVSFFPDSSEVCVGFLLSIFLSLEFSLNISKIFPFLLCCLLFSFPSSVYVFLSHLPLGFFSLLCPASSHFMHSHVPPSPQDLSFGSVDSSELMAIAGWRFLQGIASCLWQSHVLAFVQIGLSCTARGYQQGLRGAQGSSGLPPRSRGPSVRLWPLCLSKPRLAH